MEKLPATLEKMPILEHEPDEVMEEVIKVSKILKDVVDKAGLSKRFGGEKSHIFYEGWQTVAGFFSHSVKTGDAVPIEVMGIQGAKATATLYDRDGKAVGGADAYCMRDEKNWSNKPFFQLASMAQTRAGSKAFRNKFAFVVALSGFSPTPAEEMDGVHNGHEGQREVEEEGYGNVPEDTQPHPSPVTINQVTKCEGETKGKAWTLYTIFADDGQSYTTFDLEIAKSAKAAKEAHTPCQIVFEETAKGKKVVEISEV